MAESLRPPLRTFLLKNGSKVQFQFSGNPVVTHLGETTICTLYLFEPEIELFKKYMLLSAIEIIEIGVGFSEQEEIKNNNPEPGCLLCFWLDHNGLCGLASWDRLTIQEARKHPDAESCQEKCQTTYIWKVRDSV